eukprot:NODE_58_length_25774_cov_0.240545.p11 type:complete len:102 gc:universal NODE_58_length_25774_cov_0.240545:25572-25267(-)
MFSETASQICTNLVKYIISSLARTDWLDSSVERILSHLTVETKRGHLRSCVHSLMMVIYAALSKTPKLPQVHSKQCISMYLSGTVTNLSQFNLHFLDLAWI